MKRISIGCLVASLLALGSISCSDDDDDDKKDGCANAQELCKDNPDIELDCDEYDSAPDAVKKCVEAANSCDAVEACVTGAG